MIDKLKELNIELNSKQIEQFEKYYELLIEWNNVMNLTAITDKEEVNVKHFVDSLSIYKVKELENFENVNKIIDVGTGAGFPGIPLKIVFPDLEVTLIDSLNKRIKFLDEIIEKLELKGIKAYHTRAEDFGRNINYREQYDLCVSRAVANLSTLSEYCIPFVKVGGFFIPYKSGKLMEEVEESKKAIHILGGKMIKTYQFSLPKTDIERTFAIIKKMANTNKKYPRVGSKPSKEPIK